MEKEEKFSKEEMKEVSGGSGGMKCLKCGYDLRVTDKIVVDEIYVFTHFYCDRCGATFVDKWCTDPELAFEWKKNGYIAP